MYKYVTAQATNKKKLDIRLLTCQMFLLNIFARLPFTETTVQTTLTGGLKVFPQDFPELLNTQQRAQ